MDRNFLKLVSESYVVDKNINNKEFWTPRIYAYLTELTDHLKSSDLEFYDFMYHLPRSTQIYVLYSLISEDLFEESESSTGGIFNLIKDVGSTILQLPKYALDALGLLDKAAEKARDLVRVQLKGEKARIITNILDRNIEKCAKKCGVTGTPHRSTTYALLGWVASKKGHEQAQCLIDCYLDYHIEMIKLLGQQYRECLKANIDENLPKHVDIFSVISPAATCEVYRDLGLEYLASFKATLVHLFGPNSREYAEWINKLNKAIFV